LTKVYLAHAISTKGEFTDSIRVADEIRSLGFEVYAAAENSDINDKSNDPTPQDIYEADVSEILSSDILVVNVSGGHQDGTISEVGLVAGINECTVVLNEFDKDFEHMPIIAYTSNARLLQPQHFRGMSSASANHFVLGMIEKWGEFVGSEDDMLTELGRIKAPQDYYSSELEGVMTVDDVF